VFCLVESVDRDLIGLHTAALPQQFAELQAGRQADMNRTNPTRSIDNDDLRACIDALEKLIALCDAGVVRLSVRRNNAEIEARSGQPAR
jgi:hypothetical protein